MEVNKNTERRVSHDGADNDSSVMQCYAMTSSKVTYPSATIYQPKRHNIPEDPNLPKKNMSSSHSFNNTDMKFL
jgi:hypothetical protein